MDLRHATILVTIIFSIAACGEDDDPTRPESGSAPPPTIGSVSPTPIPEGGTLSVSGSNFASTADSNTVRVDGKEATVLSAASDSLEVEVPVYDCLPAREVILEVGTDAGADADSSRLEPDGHHVGGVGGLIISDPEDFCLQFDAAAGYGRYLLGVQSLARDSTELTPVLVTIEVSDGSGAAAISPASLAKTGSASANGAGTGRRVRQGNSPGAGRRGGPSERRLAARSDPIAGAGVRRQEVRRSRLGSGLSEGDTVPIRVPNPGATGDELCSDYVEIRAVVKSVGTDAMALADTENPPDGFTDSEYRDFTELVDEELLPHLVDYFGGYVDDDGNGRVALLFTKEINRRGEGGFVSVKDLSDRSSCPSSSEGEIVYLEVPDPSGEYGEAWSKTNAKKRVPQILTHELTHVIQRTRRVRDSLERMDLWLLEGQARLAEEVVGHELTGRSAGNNYGYSVAYSEDANGTQWYRNKFVALKRYFGFASDTPEAAPQDCGWWRPDPSPCHRGGALWYGVGWSFLRYVTDVHPRPSDFHRALIEADPGDRAAIVQATEDIPAPWSGNFGVLMGEWAAALYLDDRPSTVEIGFPSWDLSDIQLNWDEGRPLRPTRRPFADWRGEGGVRASSAGYLVIDGDDRPATAVRVRGKDDDTLPSHMQIFFFALDVEESR